MWAAVSPQQHRAQVCAPGDSRLKRCSPAGGQESCSEDPGWLCLLPCRCLSWLGCSSAVLQAACQEGLPVPLSSGAMAETLGSCWSFVLLRLCYRDLCPGLSGAEETCRDLVESLQEWEPDLRQDSALPLLYREITQPFCDLGFVLGERMMAFIRRLVD